MFFANTFNFTPILNNVLILLFHSYSNYCVNSFVFHSHFNLMFWANTYYFTHIWIWSVLCFELFIYIIFQSNSKYISSFTCWVHSAHAIWINFNFFVFSQKCNTYSTHPANNFHFFLGLIIFYLHALNFNFTFYAVPTGLN